MCMYICICTCIVHMHMHMHMHMHIYICISAHAGDDGGAATAGGSRGEWPPLRRAAHAGVTVRACVFVCVFVCIHACACDGKCNLPNACVYVYVICVCVYRAGGAAAAPLGDGIRLGRALRGLRQSPRPHPHPRPVEHACVPRILPRAVAILLERVILLLERVIPVATGW